MSVILEFTVDSREFHLGNALAGPPEMHLELERVVPTGSMVMPFVWATGDDQGGFETKVRDHPAVRELLVLDTIGKSALYRIEWEGSPADLIQGIVEADAVVLEAQGNGSWVYRLRFSDHDKLTRFHNYVLDHGLDIHIDRTYTLTEDTERGYQFGLSREQREALVLALKRGYFSTPSAVGLDELADELDITSQALSKRIRRGNEKILQKILRDSNGRR